MIRGEIFFISHDSLLKKQVTQEFLSEGFEISCVSFLPETPTFFDVIILPADVFLRLRFPLPLSRFIPYGDTEFLKICFSRGATDFLSTPLNIEEIVCRTENLLTKNFKFIGELGHIDSNFFTFGNVSIYLSPEEKTILQVLFRQKGSPVSKCTLTQIITENYTLSVQNEDNEPQKILSRNIDMRISKLRKKFVAFSELDIIPYISTVYGKGYLFDIILNKKNLS